MAQPIPLLTLLQHGFQALMKEDHGYDLPRFPTTVFGESPKNSDHSVQVIRVDTAEAKDWLLTAYINSPKLSFGRRALFVTANRRAHLLGHALIAGAIRYPSLRQGFMEEKGLAPRGQPDPTHS